MTGPEHYTNAQRLLALNDAETQKPGGLEKDVAFARIQCAQVHATLALTAATIECASEHNQPDVAVNGNYITQGETARAWREVLS